LLVDRERKEKKERKKRKREKGEKRERCYIRKTFTWLTL
jgi:hypothetical protein